MKQKKLIALLLALAFSLSFVLAACKTDDSKSQTSSGSTSQSDDDSNTGSDDAYSGINPDDPITFTVFIRDPGMAPASSNPVIKQIEEQTGVSLKFEFLVGDLDQKLGVMIAGGDYPDAIFAGGEASKLIEAGAFIPLEDEIPKYPNLNKLYGKSLDLMRAEDGHIYTLELYGVTNNEVSEAAPIFQCGIGFYIQKAVLEEFDYPVPTTVEEYFKLIEDYKAKYPEIDGMPTIGFEVLSDGWRNWALVNPPQHLMGAGNDGALFVDTDTFETSFYQTSDTAYEFYKTLNEMYHKGLIEPETFTQSYDQYISRLSTGSVLGFFDQYWNFRSGEDILKDDGKYDRTYITVPIANPGVKDGYMDAPTGNITGVNGIGISVNCENPERLLAFYDWLLQREVQEMMIWGEEDVDWVYTDDGGKVLTEEGRAITYDVAKKRDLTGHTLWNFCPKWQGMYIEDGAPCTPEESADEYLAALSDYDIDFLQSYGYKYPAEMMTEPVVRPDYYPIWAMTLEDGSPAAVSSVKITDATTKFYPRLILAADEAQFDSIWNDFLKEFEAIDLAAYQDEVDRQIAAKQGN